MTLPIIHILGGGLSGSECALRLASWGIPVHLYEQKPHRFSDAHRLPGCAELVCSNSLKSKKPEKAHGLLKQEMRRRGSCLLPLADRCEIPGGDALTVDRDAFSNAVTEAMVAHPQITFHRGEVERIPTEGMVVLATGPLTSEALARELEHRLDERSLYFYDATSPIVLGESLNMKELFFACRYREEKDDYLNVPLTELEYTDFVSELIRADKHEAKPFEKLKLFHGCQPIEDIALSGVDSLRFGPMRPTGFRKAPLQFPPHAVIQLRRERVGTELWNMVGFQTRLKHGEQRRIFQKLPGFRAAEFVRFGMVHRNTFINSPRHLDSFLRVKKEPRLFVAGTLSGAEGYTEAMATGLAVAGFIRQSIMHEELAPLAATSAIGSLIRYLTESDPETFQPMGFNRGLLPRESAARAERG